MARAGDKLKTKQELGRAATDVYNNLHGVLGQEILRLRAMADLLKARDVDNIYVWDDVQACLVLTKMLDEKIGALLISPTTMRGVDL